ncbi:hypothetical protein DPMN_110274 [Dreissena polymorpha]|uniref:Uncharacterized protein n=1 Tax=Dreissena polymorpha TaxID=45954 RepID=A0A9D4KC98_DREPO|nr:hypothetical protein DPMN_110274 [Dreissena polymorpha]
MRFTVNVIFHVWASGFTFRASRFSKYLTCPVLKYDKASSLVTKGSSVVTFFHTSNKSIELLEEHQGHLPEKARGHRLIQDVPTRWNLSLSMLERLSEQKQALAAEALDNCLGKHAQLLASRLFTF